MLEPWSRDFGSREILNGVSFHAMIKLLPKGIFQERVDSYKVGIWFD